MRGLRLGIRRGLRPLDIAALVVLLAYSTLASGAELGANVAGQGLDPVWAAAQQRGTLRVAVDFGFAPFSGIEHEQPVGYDIDLARAVAHKLGLRAEFIGSNLDSIYDDLAADKADLGASALPYAPEQGWRVNFSTFYFNAGQVLVVPQSSSIASQDQLDGKSFGAALGSDADTYARKLAASNRRMVLHSTYDTADAVFADLRRGALDAAIVDNASALTELQRAPGLRLVTALTFEPYALAMPARAYQLHDEVNRALKALEDEGFLAELGNKWFR